jgi:hypothetical protein
MAIEIVSFPMKNADFPVRYVAVYQAGYLQIQFLAPPSESLASDSVISS